MHGLDKIMLVHMQDLPLPMYDIKNCRPVCLQIFDEGSHGHLGVGESFRQIPFEIRRFYTISGLTHPGAVRGSHAHKKLEQVLFCLRGIAEIFVDDGFKTRVLILDAPDTGLYIPPGIWHEVRGFKNDALLLVLASSLYDESDYIRDYEEFCRHARAHDRSLP